MNSYQSLVAKILNQGEMRPNRTGIRAKTIFGAQLVHDFEHGFPALTTKKLAFKTMAAELACFLKGFRDVREFRERQCGIWDANLADVVAKQPGRNPNDLGPIYGVQWRNFGGVDQLRDVIDRAKVNPTDRRLLVSAWNPPELPDMCLPPCHTHWQLDIDGDRLNLAFYMRSVDVMLGLPFDLASYGLLQCLIANELDYKPGRLVAFLANTHIYENHVPAALETLQREPYPLPQLALAMAPGTPVERFEPHQATLLNYQHHPAIPMAMAV